MSLYRDHVYPHLVSWLGNPKPIEQIRQRIVPLAKGNVLEIGVGPGVNFVHYEPARVSKIYALEPNAGMIRRAEEQDTQGIGRYHLPARVSLRILRTMTSRLIPRK